MMVGLCLFYGDIFSSFFRSYILEAVEAFAGASFRLNGGVGGLLGLGWTGSGGSGGGWIAQPGESLETCLVLLAESQVVGLGVAWVVDWRVAGEA
jgi:hypothetical protein